MWKGIIRVLFWTYERGTLQYDLMVLAILAFIFLTPMGVFDGSLFRGEQDQTSPVEESVSTPSPSAVPEPAEDVPDEVPDDGLDSQRTR